MARHASIGIMIAAAALISWPVLAQTPAGTSPAAPPQPPGMTPRSSTTGPGGPATAAVQVNKYFTTDHHVRVGKMIGASVYNDEDQSVGSIDDVLMSENDHKAGTAIIQIGGFLGIGGKLVSVSLDQLKVGTDKIVMPGATKASLAGMPEYHYTSA